MQPRCLPPPQDCPHRCGCIACIGSNQSELLYRELLKLLALTCCEQSLQETLQQPSHCAFPPVQTGIVLQQNSPIPVIAALLPLWLHTSCSRLPLLVMLSAAPRLLSAAQGPPSRPTFCLRLQRQPVGMPITLYFEAQPYAKLLSPWHTC